MERIRRDLTLGALTVLERILDDRDYKKILVIDDEYEIDFEIHILHEDGHWSLVEIPRWLLERFSLPCPPPS